MTDLTRKITLVLGLLTGPVVFTQASYADGGPVPLPPYLPCSQASSLTYYVGGAPLPPTVLPQAGVLRAYFDGLEPLPLPPTVPPPGGFRK